jgi:hypothetical protein
MFTPYKGRPFSKLTNHISFAAQRRITKRHLCASSKVLDSEPLIYPRAQSQNHNDLQSFLHYAARTGLDPKSTVYVGTHYEYSVAARLAAYGMSLQRVGGSSDYGIDLLGIWKVPSSPKPLRTLVQCKAGTQRIGPHLVRELEGAFVGAPAGWRGSGVLGILSTERVATKGVRDSLARSRWPMAFVCCSRDGVVTQLIWNQQAEKEGLRGMGVSLMHSPAGQEVESQVVLTWNGRQFAGTETGKSRPMSSDAST